MRCGCGLLLLVLALLTLPGDGNEGSVTGSCHCGKSISSSSPPSVQSMERFRRHLKAYNRCQGFIRFQLQHQSVCGGSQDQWVHKLIRCFDRKECGDAYWKSLENKKHLPLSGTPVPKATEGPPPDMNIPAQMYLPSTQQSTQHLTLPPGVVLPLDKELTHLNETTMPTAGHRPEAGSEAKKWEREGDAAAGTSAIAPVLSLLAIIFFLTGVLLYVLCKRRRQQSLQSSPDLHLHYTPVTLDSNA